MRIELNTVKLKTEIFFSKNDFILNKDNEKKNLR